MKSKVEFEILFFLHHDCTMVAPAFIKPSSGNRVLSRTWVHEKIRHTDRPTEFLTTVTTVNVGYR